MPRQLKRYQDQGSYHFVTFSGYRRLPYLDEDPAQTAFDDQLEAAPRYHDLNVLTHEKHVEELRYMHRNQAKRGLVAEPPGGPASGMTSWVWKEEWRSNQNGHGTADSDRPVTTRAEISLFPLAQAPSLFDITNTPAFSQPNGSFGSAAFGTITSTTTDPRVAQFALRLSR